MDAPSRTDPVVATLSEVVGGPVGMRAGHHPWWSPLRVVLAGTAVTLAAGMVSKSACVRRDWAGDEQPYRQLCWTELGGARAGEGGRPRAAAYVTELAERVGSLLPGGPGTVATVASLAVLLALLASLATGLLARTDPARPWAAAAWAAAPVLALHWLSWDLVAAVGVALGLWGWARAKVAAVVAGVLLAVAFGHPLLLRRDVDIGSVWLLLDQSGWWAPGPWGRLVAQAVVVGLAAAAAYVMVWRRAAREADGSTSIGTKARVAVVVGAALLLTAPSAPPEAALLLLPLAAVGVRAWRDLLGWQLCEVVSWAITGWYLSGDLAPVLPVDARAYWLAIILRGVGLAWLALAALHDGGTGPSGHGHDVEVGRGEPDPYVDVLADSGHRRT